MAAAFTDNDVDWFRTTMSTKLRDYGGFEPTQIVAARIAREMLQAITDRVSQREAYEAALAAQQSPPT